MRSKLFVPGSRPELFKKALASQADALSFDLEDAVPAGAKDEARARVEDFVASPAVRAAAKVIIVRTNAPHSEHFEKDIAAVVRAGVALINLPKIETPSQLRDAIDAIAAAESEHDASPTRLLVNIETPKALAHAAAIATADRRVAGLQLGLADLFEPFGIARHDAANVHAAMFAVRLAAAQADVFAVDSAFARVDDDNGYSAEAAMARRLGFVGKSCIHPRQIALANAAFAPSEEELEQARRIVAAARDEIHGAFVVEGRMIDLPFLKRAQALVASAQ